MNHNLFSSINSLAGKNTFFDYLMIFCADWLLYVMFAWLVFLVWENFRKNYNFVFVSVVAALISRFIFTAAIQEFVRNPRPYLVLSDINLLINKQSTYSFPSGHTTIAFAIAGVVYAHNKRLGSIFIGLSALIGFARVYSGVHWPLDVIAGVLVGLLTSYICVKIYRRFSIKKSEAI